VQLIYLPNLISVFRLFMVPVIVWMIVSDQLLGAFIVFLIAGVSDGLDGFLARYFRWQTELGAYLDPIADKVLLVSIYAALGFFSHLPAWLVILVISRDLLIVGAVILSWFLGRTVAIQPLRISKVNTTAQIALAVLVLAEGGLGLGWDFTVELLIWLTGATTAASAAVYLVDWLRRMADYDLPERRERVDLSPDHDRYPQKWDGR